MPGLATPRTTAYAAFECSTITAAGQLNHLLRGLCHCWSQDESPACGPLVLALTSAAELRVMCAARLQNPVGSTRTAAWCLRMSWRVGAELWGGKPLRAASNSCDACPEWWAAPLLCCCCEAGRGCADVLECMAGCERRAKSEDAEGVS